MKMIQCIHFFPVDESEPAVTEAISRFKSAGYRVSRKPKAGQYTVRVPPGDLSWKPEIEALQSRGLIELCDFGEEKEYDDEELQDVGLFSFFGKSGKDVNIPPGPDHILGLVDFADWDEGCMCPTCGAGAVQVSAMRIPASSLAKRRMMTY